MMIRRPARKMAAIAICLLLTSATKPDRSNPGFEALRAGDVRLASAGERLSVANAALCERLQPALGMALHGIDQYEGDAREAATEYFGLRTPIGIAGVVPDGAAALAGLSADDSLVRVGPVEVAKLTLDPGDTPQTARLVAFDRAVAALAPDAPLNVEVLRDRTRIDRVVAPRPACRTRYEQRVADDADSSADGLIVQISSRLVAELDAQDLAALVAHELAHNILNHRRRLEAAGVSYGLLSGFGRNVGMFRQTEVEADILAVHLLVRAGYDPMLASRFWGRFGPKYAGGLRSRTHPAWRDRVATTAAEAPRATAAMSSGGLPAILAVRDRPLDGNWKALLVRAR